MFVPVTRLAEGVFKIGPLESASPERARHMSSHVSSFLVVGSERAAIVEPGEDPEVPGMLEGIKKCNVGLDRVAYVIATHLHLHHCQGVPTLLKSLPQAKFVVHPRAVPHVIDPTRLMAGSIEAWGEQCFGAFEPISRDRIMAIDDGQVLPLGGRELEILYAEGHAPHQIAILDRLSRIVWSGDIVGTPRPGKVRGHPEILPPLFDAEKALRTIRRIRALKPSMLLKFNEFGEIFTVDETLQCIEDDTIAIERICVEAMKQKISYKELVLRAEEYYRSVGITDFGEIPGGPGQLFGLLAYLRRKDPSLDIPAGATPRMR